MSLESIVIWILLGAIAGWLAGLIMKGRALTTTENIVIGILGSFFGGWLGNLLGIEGTTTGGLTLESIVTAVLGAVALMYIIRIVKRVS